MLYLFSHLVSSRRASASHRTGIAPTAWTEYIKLLPRDIPVPTLWPEDDRRLLQGTSLEVRLSKKSLKGRQHLLTSLGCVERQTHCLGSRVRTVARRHNSSALLADTLVGARDSYPRGLALGRCLVPLAVPGTSLDWRGNGAGT